MMKEFGYFNLITSLRKKKGRMRDTKSIINSIMASEWSQWRERSE